MIIELILIGLGFEMFGVIMLVTGAHAGFDDVLKYLGRSVPNDWDDRVKKIRSSNKKSTIVGIVFLLVGIFFQIQGTVLQCVPLIVGCK